MDYLYFSLTFTVIHTLSYTIAGASALKFSRDLYRGKDRLYDFLRDMDNPDESRHVTVYFLPAQILRGALMSLVFLPILPLLHGLSFTALFVFMFSAMFILTDLSSATPFPHNIEGYVYSKKKYLQVSMLPKLYYETAVYSFLFALGISLLLLYAL